MKEVEILVEVFDKKDTALRQLNKFNFEGEKKVQDIYFYDEKRSELKPKDNKLTECFRLRKKDKKSFIAYKKDYFDNTGKWTYSDEYETEVEDSEKMLKIISKLGLKPLVEINNTKHTFLTSEYEIVLEEVENLGLFLEVERLVVKDNENIQEIKKEILKFIKSLSISVSNELNIGKPELMLKKTKTKTKNQLFN